MALVVLGLPLSVRVRVKAGYRIWHHIGQGSPSRTSAFPKQAWTTYVQAFSWIPNWSQRRINSSQERLLLCLLATAGVQAVGNQWMMSGSAGVGFKEGALSNQTCGHGSEDSLSLGWRRHAGPRVPGWSKQRSKPRRKWGVWGTTET